MIEDYLLGAGSATFNPNFLSEVDFHEGEPVTGNEEMLLDETRNKVRIVGEVDCNCECTVSVVSQVFAARLDVIRPIGDPPTVGDADLRIGCLDVDVECFGHHLVPDVLRNQGDGLVVLIVAFEGETEVPAPADRTD